MEDYSGDDYMALILLILNLKNKKRCILLLFKYVYVGYVHISVGSEKGFRCWSYRL